MRGHRRKLVVLAAYLPPNYTRNKTQATMDYIADIIVDIKRKYKDPFILLTGDFNQWNVDQCLQDFADMSEVSVGNTRGNKAIDRMFLNCGRSVTESGTLAPLETEAEPGEDAGRSDHRVAYCRVNLPKVDTFKWEAYSYQHFNDQPANDFRSGMVDHEWNEVFSAGTVDEKAASHQRTINDVIERFFPCARQER